MGKYVIIRPEGEPVIEEAKKLDIKRLYALIETDCVTRTPVRYEGRKRDLWLADNGFAEQKPLNPNLRPLAEALWNRPCQDFVGTGVVWIP